MSGAGSHAVRVEPAGIVVVVRESETLLDAAFGGGRSWPTVCYGQARCTRCCVEILEGDDALEPSGEAEQRVLDRLSHTRGAAQLRLACRLRVNGDIVVRHEGVTRDSP